MTLSPAASPKVRQWRDVRLAAGRHSGGNTYTQREAAPEKPHDFQQPYGQYGVGLRVPPILVVPGMAGNLKAQARYRA